MYLEWYNCVDDVWCELNRVDLNHSLFKGLEGVYIIWFYENKTTTVSVGEGIILKELSEKKNDRAIQAFNSRTIYVTWAEIEDSETRSEVLNYLSSELKPKIDTKSNNTNKLKVNLPW